MQWFRIGVAALVAGQAMVFSLTVNLSPPEGFAYLLIHTILALSAVAVILVAGLPLIRQAIRALFQGRIVVEQLFFLGVLGALVGSLQSSLTGIGGVYYEVVAILVAIYCFNTLLGEGRRRKSIEAARAFRSQFALCRVVTEEGRLRDIRVDQICAGQSVRVAAGEGIPVDGLVTDGVAFVRETGMTGEPYPVVKRPGDSCLAGTICVDAPLTITATKDGTHRELDQLLKIVEEARFKPSGIQTMADRMVAWFLPVVVTCSLVTFAGWWYFDSWQTGLFNAMAVLIVACPCAMGLATPIGLWSAIAALAKRGLIPHTGELIERIASVDTVVFDKTGTLSDDHLQIEEMIVAPKERREELIAMISFLEGHTRHPIARAFQALKSGAIPRTMELLQMDTIPGKGIQGRIRHDGRETILGIGNADLLTPEMRALAAELSAHRHSQAEKGSLALHVIKDGTLAAMIYLREIARHESAQAASYLKASGIRTLVMSGDKIENVRRLEIPVDEMIGGMTPQEKADCLDALQKQGRKVLFVGDGANDAPALSTAHASIAMGGGASLADESAQATLFGGNLLQVVDAICLSRLVVNRIRSNILFAFFYNVTGITLAMLGWIHPVGAAVLMLISSATVGWRAFQLGEDIQEGDLGRFRKWLKIPAVVPDGGRRMVDCFRDTMTRHPVPVLLALGLAVQGPLLAWLAQLSWRYSILLCAGFVLAALWGFMLCIGSSATYTLRACFGMLAVGNLAMIIGWWADAGFGVIVREGICLCGCEKTIMGKGLLANFNLMHLGMIAGGIPGMAYGNSLLPESYRHGLRHLTHLLACLAGMYLGMMAGAAVMAQFPVGNPHFYIVASFMAMTGGMLLGMLLVCAGWFHLGQKMRLSP